MRTRSIVALAGIVGTIGVVAACSGSAPGSSNASSSSMAQPNKYLSQEPFGQTADGQPISLITLRNQHGVEVRVMNYGGIIVSLKTPDKSGQLGDIVLGHDTAAEYVSNPSYLGAVVGRYGNRIAKGKFSIDGHEYTLATNNGANHLHGGNKGWNQALWAAEPFQTKEGPGVTLTHTSPDGDEGYPGTVKAKVTYTLLDDNKLRVDYSATTDKATVINLTQHSYFNLSAGKSPDILGHVLMLNAAQYTPVDEGLIPTGELAPVEKTPFDFRTPMAIGARINDKNVQLERGKGYDHNFVLTRLAAGGLELAARVEDPASGRTLEVLTTEPGIQFYSGNFLDGTMTGKGGVKIGHRSGFCLETQHFPDSPNHPNFPSTVLRPGQTYTSTTVFAFGAK
jgi:aldose 1-epimerase